MKKQPNPATAHHAITTARRPHHIRSSILVRGRSIRSMARSGRQARRPLPRKDSHFRHFGGLFSRVVNPKRDWYESWSTHVRVTEWLWYESRVQRERASVRGIRTCNWHGTVRGSCSSPVTKSVYCSLSFRQQEHWQTRGIVPTFEEVWELTVQWRPFHLQREAWWKENRGSWSLAALSPCCLILFQNSDFHVEGPQDRSLQ